MSKLLFVEYPTCSTCRKAKKYLQEKQVDFIDRHIVEDCPTKAELKSWQELSGLPFKKFFNTSGKLYRELGIKDKLKEGMTEDEAFELLSSNGMLIKRPLLVAADKVLVGFKVEEWEALLA